MFVRAHQPLNAMPVKAARATAGFSLFPAVHPLLRDGGFSHGLAFGFFSGSNTRAHFQKPFAPSF